MSTSDPTILEASCADPSSAAPVPSAGLDADAALAWMKRASVSPEAHEEMLELARRARDHWHETREIALCGILQAKLGGCAEDCAFCCQSSHHEALGNIGRPLANVDEILERARVVESMGARAFSIVTAGSALEREGDIATVCRAIERIAGELGLETCASLGRVDAPTIRRLRDAGLTRYHHNLETAPSFFSEVITTYALDESLETIVSAQGTGLSICSSGVFGMGESDAQRVELLDLLRDLAVDALPLCFLEPHRGTPLESRPLLSREEALRIIALHRLMMPGADVIVTGGRRAVLGRHQGAALDAGANGLMVGDYPTTFGGELEEELQAIARRGLTLRRPRR